MPGAPITPQKGDLGVTYMDCMHVNAAGKGGPKVLYIYREDGGTLSGYNSGVSGSGG